MHCAVHLNLNNGTQKVHFTLLTFPHCNVLPLIDVKVSKSPVSDLLTNDDEKNQFPLEMNRC